VSRLCREELVAEATRLARYLMVGGAGLTVDAGAFTLLSRRGEGRAAARAASIAAATALTRAFNRHVTFRSASRRRREELARSASVALVAEGANHAPFLAMSALAPGLQPLSLIPPWAVVFASIAYAGQRFFTFRPAAAATARTKMG
jgi:putative flippase GtrA